MAVKRAQVIIDVNTKSLQQLNNEIVDLEKSIQSLQVGTKQWVQQNEKLGKLKQQFGDAKYEAERLQKVVEKVGGAEQAKAVLKLGTGIVGAFSGLSVAINGLGLGNKTLDEITAKGVQFLQVIQSMNAVAEVFEKGNLTALKNVGKGFQTMVASVRTASTAMKAALISTGIGALAVAVGLIIANWDKLGNLVSGSNKELKKREEQLKSEEVIVTANLQAAKQRYDLEVKNNELSRETAQDYVVALKEEQKLLNEKLETTQKQIKTEQDRKNIFGNSATDQEKLNELKKEEADLTAQIFDKKQETEKIEQATNTLEVNQEINKELKERTDRLTVLESQEKREREIFNEQLKILEKQKRLIELSIPSGREATQAEQDQLDSIEAQIVALKNKEAIRLRDYKISQESLKLDIKNLQELRKYQKEYAQIQLDLTTHLTALEAQAFQLEKNNDEIDSQIENVEELIKLNEDLVKLREQLYNFDREGKRDFKDRYSDQLELFKKYEDQVEIESDRIKSELKGELITKKRLKDLALELVLFRELKNAQIKSIDDQIVGLKNVGSQINENYLAGLSTLDFYQKQGVSLVEKLADANKKLAEAQKSGDLEKIKEALESVADLEQQINDNTQQVADTNKENNELLVDQEKNTAEINKNVTKRDKLDKEILEKEKDITAEVEKQSRLGQYLQDFTSKYAKEIEATRQLIAASIEFLAALQDRKAKIAQERIDNLNDQLGKLSDEEDERQDRILAYEEELKDANGTRYDELLALIAQEQAASIAAADTKIVKEKELENQKKKMAEAEYKAAQRRKIQAIIDASIQTALAVVEALPNVALSILVGALGAVGVATIAAQKLPPKEGFAKGGFTGKGRNDEVAGITHKNEYVVPANVANSAAGKVHIESLERQRLRGYESGGMVTPNLNPNTSTGIDYNKLADTLVVALGYMPAPEVSVVKISQQLNDVNITKKNASLSR